MTVSSLIAPHGGALVNRVADGAARKDAIASAAALSAVTLTSVQRSDVLCIATGVFSPLTGFASRADYESIVERMRLANGTVWSIPVTLAVSTEQARQFREGQSIALADTDGAVIATMEVQEQYSYDKKKEALGVYRTDDTAHPGVARLDGQGDVLLGGPITLLTRPSEPFDAYRRDPLETRRLFAERGWRRVVGFQTRNPVHRAHEYIQKAALEICDGLLLNPLVGETKSDDISAATRMDSYEVLIARYFPADRVLLSVFPAAMRYAGPREAIFVTSMRKIITGSQNGRVSRMQVRSRARFQPGILGGRVSKPSGPAIPRAASRQSSFCVSSTRVDKSARSLRNSSNIILFRNTPVAFSFATRFSFCRLGRPRP